MQTDNRFFAHCYQQLSVNDNRLWLMDGSRKVRYGELKQMIDSIAGLASSLGLSTGDRVVIASKDDAEVAQLFIAFMCNGITVINLDPDTGEERAKALISRAEPSLIILDASLKESWSLSHATATVLEIIASTGKTGLAGKLFGKAEKRQGFHGVLDETPKGKPPTSIPADTLAYILFTSGTTSQPKGVCISHRALSAHLSTLSRRFGYESDSRILNVLMLSHADGMIQGPVIAFFNQASVYRPARFEITRIEQLLDSIYQLRITHFVAVPTMLSLIQQLGLDQRDAFQGGDFRLLISCGAQLEAKLWEDIEATFKVPLVNVYGLTETVVGGCFSGPDAQSRAPGSIGQPLDCELSIIDNSGNPVQAGESGELLIRGDLLMSGYFRDEALTESVLNDGWFHTGDIARVDSDHRYWILGRAKNIIIRGGLNIHPEEITEVIQRHPCVTEAITLGLPDPVWGETVASLVVAEAGTETETIQAFCAQQLEPRKVPTHIKMVESLPRGRSGKVIIDAAMALLQDSKSDHSTASSPASDKAIEERILDITASALRTDRSAIKITHGPNDIPGWDSLAHLELVIAIEQAFGTKLTPREIMSLDRLDKILDKVSTA
ncbi:MAG: AMP-binding protein [Salinisphaeraceae bacterium]|nr:AMP-binding protein [Salinisphaeraceae bacterium]